MSNRFDCAMQEASMERIEQCVQDLAAAADKAFKKSKPPCICGYAKVQPVRVLNTPVGTANRMGDRPVYTGGGGYEWERGQRDAWWLGEEVDDKLIGLDDEFYDTIDEAVLAATRIPPFAVNAGILRYWPCPVRDGWPGIIPCRPRVGTVAVECGPVTMDCKVDIFGRWDYNPISEMHSKTMTFNFVLRARLHLFQINPERHSTLPSPPTWKVPAGSGGAGAGAGTGVGAGAGAGTASSCGGACSRISDNQTEQMRALSLM